MLPGDATVQPGGADPHSPVVSYGDNLLVENVRILKHVKDQGYEIEAPCREVYVKGPGMIFKGNPRNYLTEIQMPLAAQ